MILRDFAIRGYVLDKERFIQDRLYESDFNKHIKKFFANEHGDKDSN
ncbi:hypothetical protein [Sporomusa rhizae]